MITDAGILARSFPEDIPTGLAIVAGRRLGKKTLGEILDEAFVPNRFRKSVTPEGVEIPMLMSENLGGFGKENNKRIFDIQQKLTS